MQVWFKAIILSFDLRSLTVLVLNFIGRGEKCNVLIPELLIPIIITLAKNHLSHLSLS